MNRRPRPGPLAHSSTLPWAVAARASRLTTLAVALSLLVAGVAPVNPALAAPPGMQILSDKLKIFPRPRSIDVCTNERVTVDARIVHEVTYRTRRSGPTRVGYRNPSLGDVIKAYIADPSIGTITPPFLTTDLPDAIARFTFTGTKKGRTTITFTDNFRQAAAPATITVKVSECHYELTATSTWQLPDGYRPHLYQSWNTKMERTANPDEYRGAAVAENVAVGTPQGGCTPTFVVPVSGVSVLGNLGSDGYMTIQLTYSLVEPKTKVQCSIVGGGRSDDASPRILTFRGRAFESAYGWKPHVLIAHIAVAGETQLTVKFVKEP